MQLDKHIAAHASQLAAKDEQLAALIENWNKRQDSQAERHDRKMDAVISAFSLHSREVREDFHSKLQLVIEHCKDEIDRTSQKG